MRKVVVFILTVTFTTMSIFTNNAEAMMAPPSTETAAVIPQSNTMNPTAKDPALEAMQAVAMAMNPAQAAAAAFVAPAAVTPAPTTVVTVIAPPAAVIVTAPAAPAAAAETTAPPVETALVVEPPAAEAAFIEPEIDITDTTDTDDVINETDMEDTVDITSTDTDFDGDGDIDIDDQFLAMYGMTFADYMAAMMAATII